MSDAHGEGGGGGEGKFFFGVVAGLLVLWVFGLYRTGELFAPPSSTQTTAEQAVIEDQDAGVSEVKVEETPRTVRETVAAPAPTSARSSYSTRDTQLPLPAGHPPLAEHGITYYLDQNGEIIDVYQY